MNDDELKRLWQKQKPDAPAPAPPWPGRQIQLMQRKLKRLDLVLWASCALEIGDAAVLTPLFVWLAWHFLKPALLARTGLVIMIAASAFSVWKEISARRVSPRPAPDAPVTQWLRRELATVQAQSELARTLFWWSLLPSWIGLNAFCWGLDIEMAARIGCSALATGIYAAVWKLNYHVRRTDWLALKEDLELLLQSAESSAESEKEN